MTEQKQCKKCLEIYPLQLFYKHSKSGDGYFHICKECKKLEEKKNYHINRLDPSWLIKERKRCRERNKRLGYKEKYSEREFSEDSKKIRSISRQRWISNNAQKRRAHIELGIAVRGGHIKKLPCQICGEVKSQGHHIDYNKPLEVIWLCAKHHKEEHVRINEEKLKSALFNK